MEKRVVIADTRGLFPSEARNTQIHAEIISVNQRIRAKRDQISVDL